MSGTNTAVRRGKAIPVRTCRFCRCTHNNPCIDVRTGEACIWVARDVCSFCQTKVQRKSVYYRRPK